MLNPHLWIFFFVVDIPWYSQSNHLKSVWWLYHVISFVKSHKFGDFCCLISHDIHMVFPIFPSETRWTSLNFFEAWKPSAKPSRGPWRKSWRRQVFAAEDSKLLTLGRSLMIPWWSQIIVVIRCNKTIWKQIMTTRLFPNSLHLAARRDL